MGGFKFLGNNGFQSTLPRVERQRLFLYLDIPGNFNPRSREWSDPLKVAPLQVMPISIHAPASGATSVNTFDLSRKTDFNPRSREWSDRVVVHQRFI